MAETTKRLGNCRFCGAELDSDNLCNGCGEFICDDCDLSYGNVSAAYGSHSPYAHRVDQDDEEEDEEVNEEEDEEDDESDTS